MVTANKAQSGEGTATGAATLTAAMIPPADSLLKYDTPVLVSRNTEKRSPKVRSGADRSPQPAPGVRGRGWQRLKMKGIGRG